MFLQFKSKNVEFFAGTGDSYYDGLLDGFRPTKAGVRLRVGNWCFGNTGIHKIRGHAVYPAN